MRLGMNAPAQRNRMKNTRAEAVVCHFCGLEFVATDDKGITLDGGEILEVCGLCRERLHCDDCDTPMELSKIHSVVSSEEGWTVFLCGDCYEKELTAAEKPADSSASIPT
ncbi:hypothetical protein ACFL1X_13275, partial [Candidatus Hydrogenedentota bacterium]